MREREEGGGGVSGDGWRGEGSGGVVEETGGRGNGGLGLI